MCNLILDNEKKNYSERLRHKFLDDGGRMGSEHRYQITMQWEGNTGQGTKDYKSYERSHRLKVEGKSDLLCSSDPAFRGDPTKWNPEELLLGSLSSCHMLWYLHLCAINKIVVWDYRDNPTAVMSVDSSGAGRFIEAILSPSIVITEVDRIADAERLHHEAHQKCFIANSISFPTKINPKISAKE